MVTEVPPGYDEVIYEFKEPVKVDLKAGGYYRSVTSLSETALCAVPIIFSSEESVNKVCLDGQRKTEEGFMCVWVVYDH